MILLFFGFLLGAIGGLQGNPANLLVVQVAHHTKWQRGAYLAIGGMFPEILFAAVSITIIIQLKVTDVVYFNVFKSMCSLGLLLYGVYYLFIIKIKRSYQVSPGNADSLVVSFLRGLYHPMGFIYWIGASAYLIFLDILPNRISEILYFAIGAGIGYLVISFFTAYISQRTTFKRLVSLNILSHKVLGLICLICSIPFLKVVIQSVLE